MICNSILDALGNTPIIRLNNMTGPDDAEILDDTVLEESVIPSVPVWEQPKRSKVQSFDLHPDIPMAERHNFDLAHNEIEEVGKKERFRRNMEAIKEVDCDGYAIGGLAVGEAAEVMYHIIDVVEPHMPVDKPRYLMGVGTPQNIVEAVYRGVDFFDCVMPARNARHARLFTWQGAINLKNAKYATDLNPIDSLCDCPVCRRYSRAYIRHLFAAEEMLAMRLAVMHNLYFYNKLMEKIRNALDEGRFEEFRRENSAKLARRI